MLLISLIKIFRNTLFLWINAAWMNMIALKMYFQASITTNEKWAIPKLFFAWKNFTAHFPSEHHFRPEMLLPSSRGEIKIAKFQYIIISHVAPRTHNNKIVSKLYPMQSEKPRKSTVNTAELRQIFPLCENTLRYVVGVTAATLVRWPPVIGSYFWTVDNPYAQYRNGYS